MAHEHSDKESASSDAEALWARACELGCRNFEDADAALTLGVEGRGKNLRTGDLASIAEALEADLELAHDEGLDLLVNLLRRYRSVEQATFTASEIHAVEMIGLQREARSARATLDQLQREADAYRRLLDRVAAAFEDAKRLPDAGPMACHLERLLENRWIGRLRRGIARGDDLQTGDPEGSG